MPHVLHTIWVDKQEPTNPDTLWIRPMKKGQYGVYVYGVLGWTLITAEFKGTIGELVVSQLPEATPESNGVMSAADKAKLDALGIYYGSTEYWNEQKYFVPPAGTDYPSLEYFDLNYKRDVNTKACPGHVYSLRIYNRALTDDELASNYALDIQRFGFGN